MVLSQARFCCPINRGAQNGSVTPLKMLILLRCVLFPPCGIARQVPVLRACK
jgi:hypothetical protein